MKKSKIKQQVEVQRELLFKYMRYSDLFDIISSSDDITLNMRPDSRKLNCREVFASSIVNNNYEVNRENFPIIFEEIEEYFETKMKQLEHQLWPEEALADGESV